MGNSHHKSNTKLDEERERERAQMLNDAPAREENPPFVHCTRHSTTQHINK